MGGLLVTQTAPDQFIFGYGETQRSQRSTASRLQLLERTFSLSDLGCDFAGFRLAVILLHRLFTVKKPA